MSDRYLISSLVQRELKQRNLTADEVLREALSIKSDGFTSSEGKHFPEGTKFIAVYKGQALSATATKGMIESDGKTFTSLSAAAAHYTKRPTTNGWDFWYIKNSGKNEFVPAKQAA
jgi:hypothetical protein